MSSGPRAISPSCSIAVLPSELSLRREIYEELRYRFTFWRVQREIGGLPNLRLWLFESGILRCEFKTAAIRREDLILAAPVHGLGRQNSTELLLAMRTLPNLANWSRCRPILLSKLNDLKQMFVRVVCVVSLCS
jgi:hypothetical protein